MRVGVSKWDKIWTFSKEIRMNFGAELILSYGENTLHTLWQYGLLSFQGGYKIGKIFCLKNQHTQRK